MRKTMVDKDHPQLSVRRQCEMLKVNRNRLELKKRRSWEPSGQDREIMNLVESIHARDPTFGARQLQKVLRRNGHEISRWKIGRMMEQMGLRAIYRKYRTSIPAPENPKYPYLLRQREVSRPDEVWAADITYLPWVRGHVYLAAVMDWKTRTILGWAISNTMDTGLCLRALCNALSTAGRAPEILNTDQGSQFTGVEWLSAVESLGATVSMDGRGRWLDNVLIERLWRSVKHEGILLYGYETLPEVEQLLEEWIERYNRWRPHTANDDRTPWQAYRGEPPELEPLPPGSTDRETAALSASASRPTVSRLAA